MQTAVKYIGENHFVNTPDYVPPHHHATHELIYFVSGEGSLHCGKDVYVYMPGSVVVIPPNISHDEIHTAPSNVIFMLFTIEDETVFQQPQCYNDMEKTVASHVNSLQSEWMLTLPAHQEKLDSTLTLLLVELLRADNAHRLGNISGSTRLHTEILGLNEAYEQPSSMGYSKDHYRHLFKAKIGVPPHHFTIQNRIEKARQLLTYTTLTISIIADKCGYASASYFAMQFKKHTGQTPTEYRNSK